MDSKQLFESLEVYKKDYASCDSRCKGFVKDSTQVYVFSNGESCKVTTRGESVQIKSLSVKSVETRAEGGEPREWFCSGRMCSVL